ncbi:winged helix-turn-helix transcriptional regulator [Brevundimonas fontaquae]|uniref:Helix-turn-helix transcriptional regulator n=1 Tax=Brevundimonas fontaquae TaxID=2813778 RepID=A0ABX7LPI4_9CAUL|nr:helix-turn-helix domain-containing protein [Brevundimonas fontaquae]QSF54755.1 helix-turn-helix transcriptional regulator [Brevundimonas fontaquae]
MTTHTDRSGKGPLQQDCLWRDVFHHVTSRWGILVLIALAGGPLRFYILRNEVEGVSEKMLSQTLKLLMRDGLVLRSVETSVPPKVSYELTAMGHGLAARLSGVSSWIGDHIPDLERARSRFDQSST